ncbi:MAG: hypothetical protein GX139_12320 [Armatimonadetes bacterium]|jgi:sec-independent protein translocase protein TatA|nr:hypothetical protein [Armatimonadota bacterium]
MLSLPNGPELVFIVALALIIFGPKRLPEIGKSLGQGLRELRKASKEITDVFDFQENFNLDDDDDDSNVSSSSGTDLSDFTPDDEPQADVQSDTPKENDQDVPDSVGT